MAQFTESNRRAGALDIPCEWKPHQIREEVSFTADRIIVPGILSMRSQERKRLDCLLFSKPNIPLALGEATDNNHALSAGMDQALDNFFSPDERYPVVATTSKLLNTGVDPQTCHLIVLGRMTSCPGRATGAGMAAPLGGEQWCG